MMSIVGLSTPHRGCIHDVGCHRADASIFDETDGSQTTGSGAYIVGERGPELFAPGAGGTVLPTGSWGGHTININLGAGAQVTRDSANQIGATVARHVEAMHSRNN